MSIVYENLAGADITKAVTVVPPSTPPTGDVNVIFLKDNVDSIFNLDVDGISAVGRYTAVYMLNNKRCRVKLKSKNMYYHDLSVSDGNVDNYVDIDSLGCLGHENANPIFLSGGCGKLSITGIIRGFTHGQGIYSNAVGPVYVDDFLVEDATIALDVRAGSHVIANNVRLLKTHWVQGEGGSRAFGAFLGMVASTEPAYLEISNSQFYGVQGDGVHIHNGTLKYTNLTIQAQDVPIQTNHPIDPKAIIDPTSSRLTVIPWGPIVIPGYVNFRTVSNLGVQLNGPISVDGILKGIAPLNFVEATSGNNHIAHFGDILGYVSPLDQPFVVASGKTLDIIGTYVGGVPPVPKSPFWPLMFPAGLVAMAIGLPSGKKRKGKREQRR